MNPILQMILVHVPEVVKVIVRGHVREVALEVPVVAGVAHAPTAVPVGVLVDVLMAVLGNALAVVVVLVNRVVTIIAQLTVSEYAPLVMVVVRMLWRALFQVNKAVLYVI